MKTWMKIVLALLAVIVCGLGLLYGCLTSEWFITGQVLPRVGKAIGQPVTAGRLKVSLFSGVEIQNLAVGSGSNQLLHANTVRLRYRLLRAFQGELAVDEILLDGVKVQVLPDAAGGAKPPQPAKDPSARVKQGEKSKSGGLPLRPVIHNVRIVDASVYVKQAGENGQPLEFALEKFNLELPEFQLDKPTRIELRGDIRFLQGPEIQLTNAKLKGTLSAEIDSALQPRSVQLSVRLEEWAGHFRQIALDGRVVAAELALTGDGSRFELQRLRLAESLRGKEEAAIEVNGSGTLNPLTADLNVHVGPIQSSALNLAGALAGGLDFGQTLIDYQGTVRFQAGDRLGSAGKLSIRDAVVTAPSFKRALPPLTVNLDYALAVDLKTRAMTIDRLQSGVRESGREIVSLALSSPLTVSPAASGSGVQAAPAKLQLSIQRFNLLTANAFLPADGGTKLTGGELSADIRLEIAGQGQQIRAEGSVQIPGLGLDTASRQIRNLDIRDDFSFGLDGLSRLSIRRMELAADSNGRRIAHVNVSGALTLPPASNEISLTIQSGILDIEPLLALAAVPTGGKSPIKPAAPAEPAAKTPKPVFPVTEPPAVDLKGLNLKTDFRFEKIVYRQLLIAPLSGSLRVRDNKVVLDPLELKLNQSPIRMKMSADLGRPGYLYEAHAESGALDLQPVIQSFVPAAFRDTVSASIKSLKLDVKGAGITAANLSRNSDIHFNLETGAIALDRLPYQDVAATALSLPDLRQIRLDQGVLSVNSAANGVSLDGTRLSGPDYLLLAKGKIGFDERLDLQFTPGVGGQLESKLQSLPVGLLFTERSGKHLIAPPLTYRVAGTITQPSVPDFQKFIKEALLSAAKSQGQNLLKDAAGQFLKDGKINPQELLKGRTQPQPPTSATNAPSSTTAQPAVQPKTQEQQLIEAGGALLGGFLKKK